MPHDSGASLSRMRELSRDLPHHLEEGFSHALEVARETPALGKRPTWLVGMGGSGIAGELLRALLDRESSLPFECVHSANLPARVGAGAVVLVSSYSGNTWEVLQAYDRASRQGAEVVALTSGGELAVRAERDGRPVVRLPVGFPPRAAVGYSLGALLGLLAPAFPRPLEERVALRASALSDYIERCARPRGEAFRVARRIGRRLPVILGDSALAPLLTRWATSIEENAKRIAFTGPLTEAMHNALVGWDGMSRAHARAFSGVLLDWAGAPWESRRAGQFLRALLDRRGVATISVELSGEDFLEAVLSGIALGDFVSLALAERHGVDPLPVEAIARYRRL